jgi:hypothetical protein
MPKHFQTQRCPVAPATSTPSLPSHAPCAVKSGTQGGGQALDKRTNAEMSAKFGHDFSQIRIHTDSRAGEAAGAMGANAYALGGDIVFGAGKYNPGSRETERLLAHELTHVVQQSQSGMGDWGRASAKGDASELEADSLASQVMMGRSVRVQAAPGAAVARDPVDFGGNEIPPEVLGNSTGVPEGANAVRGLEPGLGDIPPGLANPVEIPGPPGLPAPGTMGDYNYLFNGGGAAEGGATTAAEGGAATAAEGGEAASLLASEAGAASVLPVAAVGAAAAAGVGAGMLLDAGVNKIGQAVTGDKQGDYSISNGLAHVMTATDNALDGGKFGSWLADVTTPTVDANGNRVDS